LTERQAQVFTFIAAMVALAIIIPSFIHHSKKEAEQRRIQEMRPKETNPVLLILAAIPALIGALIFGPIILGLFLLRFGLYWAWFGSSWILLAFAAIVVGLIFRSFLMKFARAAKNARESFQKSLQEEPPTVSYSKNW
jgi:uncharacterized membrane protein